MRRKLIAFVALAAAVSTGAAGCATSGQSATEHADADAPASLVFWNTGGDDETAVFQQAADLYNKRRPNVTVKVQTLSWDDAFAKMLAASASRSGPDIVASGLTYPVRRPRRHDGPAQARHRVDQAAGPSAAVESGRVPRRQRLRRPAGNVHPRPLTSDIGKLQAAGVKRPFSIDWGNMDWIGFANYLYQAGGTFYTPGCKPSLQTPQAERALTYWTSLYRQYGAPTATIDGATALETGTALVSAGSRVAGQLVNDKPKLKGKWSMTVLPSGPTGPTTFIGGRSIGVTSYSKYAAQATGFLKFLYTDEAIKTIVDGSKARNLPFIPARQDRVRQSTFLPEQSAVFEQAIRSGAPAPGCPGWDQSAADVSKRLQSVILGRTDTRTALREADAVMARNAG